MTSIIALRCGRYMQLARGVSASSMAKPTSSAVKCPPANSTPRPSASARSRCSRPWMLTRSSSRSIGVNQPMPISTNDMPTAAKCRSSSSRCSRGIELGEAKLDVAARNALLALLREPQQASEPTSDAKLPRGRQLRGAMHEAEQCPHRPVARPPKWRERQFLRELHATLSVRGSFTTSARHRDPVAARDGP